MTLDAEVEYWKARALFYERRLLALGEGVDYPTPTAPAKPWRRGIAGQLTVDDCIAEVERS
jgi:hypothetical protein